MAAGRQHRLKQIEDASKVSELLASGLTVRQIHTYVKEKLGWECTEKRIFGLIKKANTIFAEESKAKITEEYGKGLRRLNMLFAASLKIQDFKACLAIQREINAMMGFTGKSVTVNGDINAPTQNNSTMNIGALQLEYVGSTKEIATSEDQVDLSRGQAIIEIHQDESQDRQISGRDWNEPNPPSEQEPPTATISENEHADQPKFDVPQLF